MTQTKKTYHEGAEAERKALKSYLKRQMQKYPNAGLGVVYGWIQGRCDRYKKIKGGL